MRMQINYLSELQHHLHFPLQGRTLCHNSSQVFELEISALPPPRKRPLNLSRYLARKVLLATVDRLKCY